MGRGYTYLYMGMIHLRKGVIPVYETEVIPLHGSDTPLYEGYAFIWEGVIPLDESDTPLYWKGLYLYTAVIYLYMEISLHGRGYSSTWE